MNQRIYLSPPDLNTKEKEILLETLESNWIAPFGPNIDLWRKELAQYLNVEDTCLTSSGTAAMHLALRILNVGEGDIVLAQTHNHIGSVNPILYQGAKPVFIDSEPNSWNMDPEALDLAISKIGPQKVKCIVVVHIYGMPANMDAILEIANKHSIPVVEDAAESLGSLYQGKHTGTLGTIGIFSFNGNKILTTGGGGALVSKDPEIVKRAAFLANQAREKEIYFEHKELGYNYTISNVLAAIGRGQMTSLDDRVQKRRKNFDIYRRYFESWNQKGYHIKFQPEDEKSWSNRWLSTIVIDPNTNRGLTSEKIRLRLDEANIESRPLWKAMHLQPLFSEAEYFGNGLSENLFYNGLCLPSGSDLTDAQWARIKSSLDSVF